MTLTSYRCPFVQVKIPQPKGLPFLYSPSCLDPSAFGRSRVRSLLREQNYMERGMNTKHFEEEDVAMCLSNDQPGE